eukprot:299614-Chlamydomonas_euryale.AAC.1
MRPSHVTCASTRGSYETGWMVGWMRKRICAPASDECTLYATAQTRLHTTCLVWRQQPPDQAQVPHGNGARG